MYALRGGILFFTTTEKYTEPRVDQSERFDLAHLSLGDLETFEMPLEILALAVGQLEADGGLGRLHRS